MASPSSGIFSRTALSPLRLLIYLVRLLAAMINVLVYFLFALVLYLVTIPLFVLNALVQGLLYPVRLMRGESGATNFRVAALLRGPYDMFMHKEEELVDWVRAAWTVFEPASLRNRRKEAEKAHIRKHAASEIKHLSEPASSRARREPTLPGFGEDEIDIPVLGKDDRLWRGKSTRAWRYLRLHCPYCGAEEMHSRRGYPVLTEGADVLQFVEDPGSEYSGGEGYGVWACAACGETSYVMEMSPSRGAYNYWTRQWERRPRPRFKPVTEISAAEIAGMDS